MSISRSFVFVLAAWVAYGEDAKPRGAAKPGAETKPNGAAKTSPPPKTSLADYYGFLPVEVYKLDFRIKNLLVRDVNGDGKNDIVVVNNLKNRIDVLEQRADGEPETPEATSEVNELTNPGRLKHRKIPTTRAVGSLEIKDLNKDNRADLVMIADPPGLYVEYQDAAGGFGQKRSFETADAQQASWMVDVGDTNADGRTDIVFLGKENLYVLLGKEDGRLDDPKRFRLAEGGGSLLRLVDFDGDGRPDLTYMSDDKQYPVRVRYQTKSGKLGAERRFAIDPPRGVSFANVDGKPGEEMMIISDLSDRLIVYAIGPAEKEDAPPTSKLVSFPFEKSGPNLNNDLAIADLDGDGRSDVVVSDPDAARLVLYTQREGEGLDLGQSYPALLGTTLLRVIDTPDGAPEVLSLSEKEGSISSSRFEGGRLTFPQPIGSRDEPVVMEVIPDGAERRLIYLAKIPASGGGNDLFSLRQIRGKRSEGKIAWSPANLGGKAELPIQFPGKPFDLRAVDANGDGRLDLVFFFYYQPPLVYLGAANEGFEPVGKSAQGTLGTATPASFYFGPVADKKPALLVAQSNFARNLKLEANGRWNVVDQYNATTSPANVSGVTALDLDGDGVLELAMYDKTAKEVIFLKRQNGLFQRWKKLDAGAFNLRGIRVADLDADGKSDLLLYDANQMGIAYAGRQDAELKPLATYESEIRRGKLFDMVPGDLNADGRMDILLLEPVQRNLEIVAWMPNNRLARAISWRVFDEKTFRQTNRTIEPREAVVGDVNNDGRNDVVVLAHDRVLVYLQDSGEAPKKEPAAGGQ